MSCCESSLKCMYSVQVRVPEEGNYTNIIMHGNTLYLSSLLPRPGTAPSEQRGGRRERGGACDRDEDDGGGDAGPRYVP